MFSSSYLKLNYFANPNNLISLYATSHSHSLTPLLFVYNWVGILVHIYFIYQLNGIYFVYNQIGILVHVYFVYQLMWQVRCIFILNLIIIIIINCPTYGFNLTHLIHMGWVKLGWTPVIDWVRLGWVGLNWIFFNPL